MNVVVADLSDTCLGGPVKHHLLDALSHATQKKTKKEKKKLDPLGKKEDGRI